MEKGSVKNKQVASMMIVLLILGVIQVTLNFAPLVLSEPSVARREVWQVVNVANTLPYNTIVDVNVTVNSRKGVNIACSTNVTKYFENVPYWQGIGYPTYMDWLNGTSMAPHHWGEMDWSVSNGSLTNITYNDIQFWGDMYLDSGGGVNYVTFMGNTYMADWNLSSPYNHPDIIYQGYWQANQIKMIDDFMVPANSIINIVFKIVMTEPGGYTFNVVTTPGVTASPSSWTVGGATTLLVPYDYQKIQDAINAATPGYAIIVYNETVHNGLYAEDLGIPETKTNLEIKADGSAPVTIKGVAHHGVPGPMAVPNIGINASGVKIHGFTIEGPDYQANYYATGMVIGAPNVEIYDNTFKVTAAANGDEISQAIQTWRYNSRPTVDISGLNIRNNTFTHLSAGSAGYEGIWINLDTGKGAVTVRNNTFSGNVFRAITTERSNVTINSNVITTDLGPNDPGLGGWQGINVMGANGYEPGDTCNVTTVSVTGNIIKGSASGRGFRYGIKLGYNDASTLSAISITNNTIHMNEVGVWVRFSANGVKVTYNNIFSNTNYGVSNTYTSQTADAAYNWWGNEMGPYHPTLNPSGTGNSVSDNVVFEPWLIKPNPPLAPISVVYVNPPNVALTTPALGTSFNVDVTIANVTMLYGFQFSLLWNNTLLSLTSVTWRIPSVWGSNYFIGVNNPGIGNYTFGATARVPAPSFNGTTTVASLRFQVIYDPVYPSNVNCSLTLDKVTIADPTANPILKLVHSGNYSCISLKPNLLFMSSEYTAKKVPTEFDADINVTSVVNLYAFDFNCTFNTTLLNVVNVNITIFGGNPAVIMGWDNNVGYFHVSVTGITPPANGSRTIARVRFKVQTGFVWNTQTPSVNCTLVFNPHNLTRQGGAQIEHDAVNGTYVYRPVPGDVSMDGLVDIVDLLTVAQVFGSESGGPPYHKADLNHDGKIDILDIILVARNFGSTDP